MKSIYSLLIALSLSVATVNGQSIRQASQETVPKEEAIRTIRTFYRMCISDSMPQKEQTKFMTEGLMEKMGRVTVSTGAVAVLRAQDTADGMLESLTVCPLQGNWYMVNYTANPGTGYERTTNIPVRVRRQGGRCMLDYITPWWHDTLYGDSLIGDSLHIPPVRMTSPQEFVRSFYDAYTMLYASMPAGLEKKLEAMRRQYLTDEGLVQFEDARNDERVDGWVGYDVLIADFDFDNLWRRTLKVIPEDSRTFLVRYSRGKDNPFTVRIKVAGTSGNYRIDGMETVPKLIYPWNHDLDTLANQDVVVVKDALHTVRAFYKNRIQGLMTRQEAEKTYLTQGMCERAGRIGNATGTDLVIRAKDISPDRWESFSIMPLGKGWFKVEFAITSGNRYTDYAHIPLRVCRKDDRYLIDYITPVWHDELYGDSLIGDSLHIPPVKTDSPQEFVRSFYDAYTMLYASMPAGLEKRLEAMRGRYLTGEALTQFADAQKEADSQGYDALVNNFDFDNLWRNTLQIVQEDKLDFCIIYHIKSKRSEPRTILARIKITGTPGNYRIAHIEPATNKKP